MLAPVVVAAGQQRIAAQAGGLTDGRPQREAAVAWIKRIEDSMNTFCCQPSAPP
ncbi:MAG: hypothetical protein WA159_10095 [Variovorax sp.]